MTKHRIPTKLRQLVKERAGGCCEYCICQEDYGPDAFSTEHINPLSVGGKSIAENLARACQRCNNHKYNKTTRLIRLARNPSRFNIRAGTTGTNTLPGAMILAHP